MNSDHNDFENHRNAVETWLISAVVQMSGLHKVTSKTRMLHDASMYGDDAYDVMMDIYKKCGTKFTHFDFKTYFPNESGHFIWRIYCALHGRHPWRDYPPITIEHLVNVIIAGEWFDP